MLFLHSLCLQVGGLISDQARASQQESRAKTEVVEMSHSHGEAGHGQQQQQPQQQASSHGHGGRARSFAFADIKVPSNTKRAINIVALIAIYGSYLFLRIRKARKKNS